MASVYPNNPDAFDRTTPSDPLTGHSDLHDDISDAVENIQAFVGVSGDTTAGTIVKRVTDLEQKDITLTLAGDLTGSATITNLGNTTITASVVDDSHNHTIGNVDNLQTSLNALDRTPTGAMSMFAGSSAPSGWLLCQGGSFSTTTYASLFAVIGYTYGGSGSTFKVPDMRDRVPVGAGTSYTLNQAVGATTDSITLASSNLPKHTHGLNGHYHSVDPPSTSLSLTLGSDGTDYLYNRADYGATSYRAIDVNYDSTTYGMAVSNVSSHTHSISGTVNIASFNSGGNSGNTTDGGFANSAFSVDIIQPSRGINYIIKY